MRSTVCVLLSAALVLSGATASPFCDSAEDKVLCEQLVGGASTWGEAMTNALSGVQKRAEGGKSVAEAVAAKLPAAGLPQTKEAIVRTCQWAYDRMMDSVKACGGLVKDSSSSAIKHHLSPISYGDCTQALSEFDLSVPEATQFDTEMHKLSTTLLAIAEKNPSPSP
ncbi:hypothetical protein AAHA92_07827 [Salvia divinorum]|uniref:Pectinesterase inhibitor domain-containing protein n=1 Tax=Salvia divinorum TaxID=28513 RepID=A0ABD1IA89_SALDI